MRQKTYHQTNSIAVKNIKSMILVHDKYEINLYEDMNVRSKANAEKKR